MPAFRQHRPVFFSFVVFWLLLCKTYYHHTQCQHFLFYPQSCGFSPRFSFFFSVSVDRRACHPRPSVPLQCVRQPRWADSGWEVFQGSYGSPNLEQTLTFYQWEHALYLWQCSSCSFVVIRAVVLCGDSVNHHLISAVLTFLLLLLDMLFVWESAGDVLVNWMWSWRDVSLGLFVHVCFVWFVSACVAGVCATAPNKYCKTGQVAIEMTRHGHVEAK